MTTGTHPAAPARPGSKASRAAAALAVLIAVVYLLLATGVLSLGEAEPGELGILGAAGGVHLLLGVVLWLRPWRWLMAIVILVQLALAGMYVAIAPERDPSFEVWGLTLRGLSLLLVVALVLAMLPRRTPG